jgi:murein DD-endopeptidase MepM/ murein hydrolase activator NlpD
MAVEEGVNPWALTQENDLRGSWDLLPEQVLSVPGTSGSGPGAFPSQIQRVSLTPEELVQGQAALVEVVTTMDAELSGSLNDHALHFFSDSSGLYLAHQGIHARAKPGLAAMQIQGTLEDGTPFSHRQMVLLQSGNYPYETFEGLPEGVVSREVSDQEDEIIQPLAQEVTPVRMWSGSFQNPMPEELGECWPSLFGNRRSLNGSGYYFYHSGLDFCGREGVEIRAPAAGNVVFVDDLVIRGNYTMIDHGRGIYTAYAHQSEVLVEVGQTVEAGQVIGKVGSTGRSTGPHLHWEVWVGGVPVDPMQWLEGVFP